MSEILETALSWLGISLGAFGLTVGAAWFFGLMPVLGAVATVVAAALAPIIGAVVQGIIWLWQNVIWPGLWDILEDWVTVLTVALMAFMLWTFLAARFEVAEYRLNKEIAACKTTLKAVRKAAPPIQPQVPWPFGNW